MRVVVVENLTLDRVMQAPGRADEDVRGGFQHGGWGLPYYDPVAPRVMGERMQGEGALLLGRRTYLDLADVWPKRTNNPFTERLNNSQKYVASRTLKEPLPWMNSTLLEGDAAEAVARLKPKPGNLTISGSGALAQSLMRPTSSMSTCFRAIRSFLDQAFDSFLMVSSGRCGSSRVFRRRRAR